MQEALMKAKLIDYLLMEQPNNVICSELIFFGGNRRADIVCISDALSVYEIKGDLDKLDTVTSQVTDYQACFDFTYLATTKKHLTSLIKILPKTVGIILITEDKVICHRKATRRKRLEKSILSSLLPRETVTKLLSNLGKSPKSAKKSSVTSLRKLLSENVSTHLLRNEVINHLKAKFEKQFSDFLYERGSVTHPDDLLLLTSKPRELKFRSQKELY